MKPNKRKDLDLSDELAKINAPEITSSAHGKINKIMLSIPNPEYLEGISHLLLSNLIKKLPSYTNFVIWAENTEANRDELQAAFKTLNIDYYFHEAELGNRLAKNAKCTVILAPKHHNFSPWIQDPFVVVNDEDSYFLIEPWTQVSGLDDDFLLAEQLSSTGLFRTIGCPLYFHGGNILVGDDFVMIGSNHFNETKRLLENNEIKGIGNKSLYNPFDEFVVNTFELFFGRKRIIPIGLKIPAFTHIDMYVSLAGRNSAGDYIILVAEPIALHVKDFKIVLSLKRCIDQIVASIRKERFIVLRNPIPYVGNKPDSRGAYYCLYNNCLVEIEDENKTVWIPSFACGKFKEKLKSFDIENYQIWKALGFDVQFLMNFHGFSQKGGGVRCLVKYLKR